MRKLKCIYGIINVFFNRKRRYFNNPIRGIECASFEDFPVG